MAERRQASERSGMKSFLRVLLPVVLIAFCLSSGMVGFVLGKSAPRATGELLDTIVLSPGDSSQARRAAPRHVLTGRVLRADGDPCGGVTVRLRDEERSDVTDRQGKFYFTEIGSGSHVLELLDDGGQVLSELEILLDFTQEETPSADVSGTPVSFLMPEETRLLEIPVTMDETADNALSVEKESAYFVTRDGQVVNFKGAALPVEEETHAVTAQGNVVDFLGYVLLPSREVVFTPRGEEVTAEVGEEAAPGMALEEDGTVVLEEGASVLPTGEVLLPDGETVGGGDGVVLVTEESAQELEELPEEFVPLRARIRKAAAVSQSESQEEPSETSEISPEPEESQEPVAAAESEGPAEEISSAPEPQIQEPEPEPEMAAITPPPIMAAPAQPTPTPEPQEGLRVTDTYNGEYRTWEQVSTIDLFKNRYFETYTAEEEGVLLAAPGTAGYYVFQLENPEAYEIAYSFTLEEGAVHLPIRYTVMDLSNDSCYLFRERIPEGGKLTSEEITIPAGTVQEYRIDWSWDYEDWFRPKRDNAIDTAAATGKNRTYLLELMLTARQTTPQPAGHTPSGDVKLPGKR